MNRPTYHHGDLRAAILTEAARLVAERGAERVSLRELAREAGVSHAAPPTTSPIAGVCSRHWRRRVFGYWLTLWCEPVRGSPMRPWPTCGSRSSIRGTIR